MARGIRFLIYHVLFASQFEMDIIWWQRTDSNLCLVRFEGSAGVLNRPWKSFGTIVWGACWDFPWFRSLYWKHGYTIINGLCFSKGITQSRSWRPFCSMYIVEQVSKDFLDLCLKILVNFPFLQDQSAEWFLRCDDGRSFHMCVTEPLSHLRKVPIIRSQSVILCLPSSQLRCGIALWSTSLP
jgi:hypothetical protein